MEFVDKMNDCLQLAMVFPSADKKFSQGVDLMVEFTNTHGLKQYNTKRCSGKTREEILNLMMSDLHTQTAPERKMAQNQPLLY
jgi:hypothetical protein